MSCTVSSAEARGRVGVSVSERERGVDGVTCPELRSPKRDVVHPRPVVRELLEEGALPSWRYLVVLCEIPHFDHAHRIRRVEHRGRV